MITTSSWYHNLLPVPNWDATSAGLCNLIEGEVSKECAKSILSGLYDAYVQGLGAVKNHHNFIGGLVTHTHEILNMFLHIHPSLPFKVDPFIVTMAIAFHDFGKLSVYNPKDMSYKPEISLLDHPYISAKSAAQILTSHHVDARTITFIESAILSHHGRKEWGHPSSQPTLNLSLLQNLTNSQVMV